MSCYLNKTPKVTLKVYGENNKYLGEIVAEIRSTGNYRKIVGSKFPDWKDYEIK